jgi:hypothetical protein
MWVITKDLLFNPQFDSHPIVGKGRYGLIYESPEDPKLIELMPHTFRLRDDDGILYYEGRTNDDSSFDPLDWAMNYAGCTRLEFKNKATGVWEPL